MTVCTLRNMHDPDSESCNEIVEKMLLPFVLWQPVKDWYDLHEQLGERDAGKVSTPVTTFSRN